jgi:hypothetical protein
MIEIGNTCLVKGAADDDLGQDDADNLGVGVGPLIEVDEIVAIDGVLGGKSKESKRNQHGNDRGEEQGHREQHHLIGVLVAQLKLALTRLASWEREIRERSGARSEAIKKRRERESEAIKKRERKSEVLTKERSDKDGAKR